MLVKTPRDFLRGLLGMNVGGIPGAKINWAFLAVCAISSAAVEVEVWILEQLKWL